MRFFLRLPVLAVLAVAYPYNYEDDDKTIISSDYYPESLVIYEGKHDIVDIMVPLNSVSMYEDNTSDISQLKEHLMIFFIEADLKLDQREDHGIYLYRKGKTIQIMDKGTAVAASADESQYVFLGAKDGLYVYNPETQKADKFGNFNNSVKDIAVEHNSDVIYILTSEQELYKTYDGATKTVRVDDIKDAEQIMMDYSNNLYYYSKDKKPYVRTTDGKIKKIEDLPEGAKELKLIRPPILNNEGVGLIVDTEVYVIYPDGSSESDNLEFMPEAKPTVYSMEAGIFRYFGYKSKIYEYDLTSMIDSSESISDLKRLSNANIE